MDSSPAVQRKTSEVISRLRRFGQKISSLFRQMPSQEEPDTLTNHMFDQLEGGTGDPVSQATFDKLIYEIPDDWWHIFNDQDVKYSNFPSPLRGGNDDPMAEYPDDEPPSDTDTDGREDRGASNNENVDLHDNNGIDPNQEFVLYTSGNLLDPDDVMDGGSEGQGTRSRTIAESQAGIGIIPAEISSSMMNNEPAISENYSLETFSPNNETTVESEVSSTESGYQSSASTSSSINGCSRIGDIEISPSPEVVETKEEPTSSQYKSHAETEDVEPTSSTLYASAGPPGARDVNNQQEPTAAEQVTTENAQLPPDEYEYDSYDAIFSGPLQTPKNQTVGPSSSDHGCDFQHQSWSSTTEATPSRTDSGFQSSPSTSSPSNVSFPELMEAEYGEPAFSQNMLSAPAHPSRANGSEISYSQQPKQYCDMDKNAPGSMHQFTTKYDFSGTGTSEPWPSYYGIGIQHDSLLNMTEAIPSNSVKMKRSSPNSLDQCHHPAKKCRLDRRQLPYSPSVSVQRPITQEFNHESCNLNAKTAKKSNRRCTKQRNATSAPVPLPVSDHDSRNFNPTTFESNVGSIRQHDVHSPPVQQSDAQEHPLDFLDLKPFQEFGEKKEKYLKKLEGRDTPEEQRVRQRTKVEDESVREEMDRNCEYSKKCAKKKKEAINDRMLEFVKRVQEMEDVISKESMGTFSLELDDFLGGRIDNSASEAYETEKRQLFSTDVDSETEQTIQKAWELLNEMITDFKKKSQQYADASKNAENRSKEEKKNATSSPGSAKSRAKSVMEGAQLDYDIACLDLIISKKAQLASLSLEFARRCVNKIAPRASLDAKKIEEWVHRNGKTEEWNELKSFINANPELRSPNLYN
ncbi:hypothetical protein B9Z55_015213 [Caenorhabditis nigoni]|nr:hypothetical protein B9Z55_015213 [Caenorhabditis nigoni]